MVAVMEQAIAVAEVVEMELVGDLRQFLALAKAIKTWRVGSCLGLLEFGIGQPDYPIIREKKEHPGKQAARGIHGLILCAGVDGTRLT